MTKCKDCPLVKTDAMTAYDGRGLVDFSFCTENWARGKMVDPDVERDCDVDVPAVLASREVTPENERVEVG